MNSKTEFALLSGKHASEKRKTKEYTESGRCEGKRRSLIRKARETKAGKERR